MFVARIYSQGAQRGSKHLCDARPNLPRNKCLRVPWSRRTRKKPLLPRVACAQALELMNQFMLLAGRFYFHLFFFFLTWRGTSFWWGFLAPDNLENHANEGKGKKKKKEQEEKAMAALLVFILATLTGRGLFGGNVFKNPARCRIRHNW